MMPDIDYGCNEDNPESIIAVILDNANTAKLIMFKLDKLGYMVIKKSEFESRIS